MAQPHFKPSSHRGPRGVSRLRVGSLNAHKRLLVGKIVVAMRAQRISKTEMAHRMGTSRTQLERLLDPDNDRVLLDTVQRAASAVGKELRFMLVDVSQYRGDCHE